MVSQTPNLATADEAQIEMDRKLQKVFFEALALRRLGQCQQYLPKLDRGYGYASKLRHQWTQKIGCNYDSIVYFLCIHIIYCIPYTYMYMRVYIYIYINLYPRNIEGYNFFSHQTSIIAGFSQQNACTNLGLHPGYPLRNLQAGFYEINGSPNNQKIMGFRPLRVL